MSFLADIREFENTSAAANRLLTRPIDEVGTIIQSISTSLAEEEDRMKEQATAYMESLQTMKTKTLEAQKQAKEQLMQLKKRIKDTNRLKKELKAEIDCMTEEMNSKYRILQEETEAKAKREEESASRIDRTAKNLQRMMDTFCFHVRRVEGDQMQCVFTHIDRDDHERICYFLLTLLDGKQYEVTETHPDVPDKDKLLAQLNESNNFSRFVATIRKRFQTAIEEDKRLP